MLTLKSDRKGFTLIELIVVIAVLGVLAAIIIPRFSGFVDKAKNAADQADLKNLNTVTSAYRAEKPPLDPFEDINRSADYLMGVLVDREILASTLVPRQKDASFEWDFNQEKWLISSTGNVLTADQVTFGNNFYASSISGYLGTSKDILIPQKIGNITVAGIYQNAFKNVGLTSLQFDENSAILQMHTSAFEGNALKSMELPKGIKTIDVRAFYGNDLTEIVLPPSLVKIGVNAFYGNEISKITIGTGVVLDNKAFANDNTFKDAYYAQGAGTYSLVNGNWVKQ